jgi:hypothetical protein
MHGTISPQRKQEIDAAFLAAAAAPGHRLKVNVVSVGWGMLKTIKKNTFDVVAGLVIIALVFYLAVITYIMPVPENVLIRINEIATDVIDVLVACVTWLISFLPMI